MTWLDIAKEENARAEQALKDAQTLSKAAERAYADNPTREHRLAFLAAQRLVRESEAQAAEWELR